MDSSFTLQWRSINTYFIAGFCTKNFPKLWGIFFQCLKNRMANLKEHLWELSLVLLNRNPETPGSRKMLHLALSATFSKQTWAKRRRENGENSSDSLWGVSFKHSAGGLPTLQLRPQKNKTTCMATTSSLSVLHEKQYVMAFIFYYLKRIVTRRVISIILCSL